MPLCRTWPLGNFLGFFNYFQKVRCITPNSRPCNSSSIIGFSLGYINFMKLYIYGMDGPAVAYSNCRHSVLRTFLLNWLKTFGTSWITSIWLPWHLMLRSSYDRPLLAIRDTDCSRWVALNLLLVRCRVQQPPWVYWNGHPTLEQLVLGIVSIVYRWKCTSKDNTA